MKKVYFACSLNQLILLIASFIFLIFILVLSILAIDYFPIIIVFSVAPICWLIMIFFSTSLCILKKDKLYVKRDTVFNDSYPAQVKTIINYSDIESIEIINVERVNTRGEDVPIAVPWDKIKFYREQGKKVFNPGKSVYINLYDPKYIMIYGDVKLEILKINLKNTEQYEGSVLNLYKPKKKEQLINDLKLKIDKC